VDIAEEQGDPETPGKGSRAKNVVERVTAGEGGIETAAQYRVWV